MKNVGALSLVALMITAVVGLSSAPARSDDTFAVCIGTKPGPPGAPRIDLTLTATPARSFFELFGQAQFSQAVAPPHGLVIFGVSGTAISNADGFWLSLTGAGYDLAKTVFNGTLGIQLSADPAKNALTYVKQSLDGTSDPLIVTGIPEIKPCP
jgi:hypothetical protein